MRCLVWFWPSRLRADCLKDLAGLHEVLDVLPQDCVLRFEPQVLLLNLADQSKMSIVTLHQSQLTLSTRCVRSSSVFCSSNTWAISRAFSSCSSWKCFNVPSPKIFQHNKDIFSAKNIWIWQKIILALTKIFYFWLRKQPYKSKCPFVSQSVSQSVKQMQNKAK